MNVYTINFIQISKTRKYAFKKDLVIDFQILHQVDGFVGKHLV